MELLADRNYWRMQNDIRLIEEARHSGHELCIVLGERLEDIGLGRVDDLQDDLDEACRERDRLDDRVFELCCEVDNLQSIIEQLTEQLKKDN